jgi:serine/threonine protein kinase
MNEWMSGVSAIPDSEGVGSPDRRSLDYADIEVGDVLGQGGSSDVFEATVAGVDGPIALKEPRLQVTVTRRQVESFLEEAERWAAVDDHPNVVGVVDWSGTPVPWIALEHMDGGTLRARLDAEEGIGLAEAL